jgi:hypothetical protein
MGKFPGRNLGIPNNHLNLNLSYWKCKFELDPDCKIKYDPEKSVFPPYKEIKMEEENYLKPSNKDFKDFQISDLNWISFGNLIVKLYNHLMDNGYVSIFLLGVQENPSKIPIILECLLLVSLGGFHETPGTRKRTRTKTSCQWESRGPGCPNGPGEWPGTTRKPSRFHRRWRSTKETGKPSDPSNLQ